MATKIRSIERRPVPGGVELIARGKSNRGTSYISNSMVVLRGDLPKDEFRKAIREAIRALLS